jgi:Cu+-exporting ATPase
MGSMNETNNGTKDPICGMTVDKTTALHAQKDGKEFYFCGQHCKEKFLSKDPTDKSDEKSGGCCG